MVDRNKIAAKTYNSLRIVPAKHKIKRPVTLPCNFKTDICLTWFYTLPLQITIYTQLR